MQVVVLSMGNLSSFGRVLIKSLPKLLTGLWSEKALFFLLFFFFFTVESCLLTTDSEPLGVTC